LSLKVKLTFVDVPASTVPGELSAIVGGTPSTDVIEKFEPPERRRDVAERVCAR
jgi:hypothetical protein